MGRCTFCYFKSPCRCDIPRACSVYLKQRFKLGAGLTVDARRWHWLRRQSREWLLHLTLIALSAERAPASPAADWWIIISKKCPEKVIPLNKMPPSIHQRTSLTVGFEKARLRPKPGRKCWAQILTSKSQSALDAHCIMIRARGSSMELA